MSARGRLLATALLLAAGSAAHAQGTIDTVAGGGPGDGSPALAVNLRTPQDVVRDAAGVTYIAVSDDRRVYKIALDGTIALVAGSGGSGSFGDAGPATKAELVSPKGLAFDTDGSLLIADEGGRRIRRVDLSSGKISTLVGGGALTGEGVPALQVLLDAPRDVVAGPGGNLFIADGNRIRKLDRTTGLVTTVAGSTTAGFSDGSPAATKRLSEPRALAFDAAGSLYIADGGNGRIRKLVLGTDTISTLVNNICSPGGVATDAAGAIYFNSNTGSCGNNGQKYMKWVSGSVSTIGNTGSSFVAQIASLASGSLLVADRDNYRIRTVSAAGSSTNFAGNGTIGTYGNGVAALAASFLSPTHVRADAAGNIYVYDGTNQIRRVTPAGIEVTAAATANCGSDPNSFLCSVEGLAMLAGGDLAISESKNDKIRRLNPVTGTVTDLTSAALGKPKGIATSASGFVFVADRGNGNSNGTIRKVEISNGTTTVIASNLAKPQYIAVDGADNVYFASLNGSTILKIAAGSSTAVNYVTLTSAVTGLDADASGNLFAADSSDQVWRIAAGTGTKSLYAGAGAAGLGDGGSPLSARLSGPNGLSLVGANVYIADALNYRIRVVRPNMGPSASAGADQVVEATAPSGATVALDGAASSDPDGDALIYSWSGPFGSASGVSPSVTLPLGTHTITLSVSDGQVSSSDTVSITVQDTIAPTISAVRSPLPNANGWNNTDVTVSFSCTDSGSGLSFGPPAPQIVTLEAAGQSRSFTCTDVVGNQASLTVSGINIDKTAPVVASSVSPKANPAGWNNTDVTVSFAATDGLSGVESCDPAVVLAGEGAGQSASGACTDRAGNVASATVPGLNIDKTAPVATALRAPSANAHGWNNSDVTVTIQGSDTLSGIDGCTAPVVLSAEGAGQSASGSCTDAAGNVSASASVTNVNIDKTAPVALAAASPSPNVHGWNNTDVTVAFSATDVLSGVLSCDASIVLSGEAAGQSASGACTDLAGNSAQAAVSNVNIDKTAPSLSFAAASPAANANGWNNTDVVFAFTASDLLSGVDSTSMSSPLVLSSEGSAVSGSVSVTDLAGNTASFDSPVVMIDKTAPIVSASRFPLANAHGWNNTDVTVSFSATDVLSGIGSCGPDVVLSSEGASQSATRSCTDLAGNTAEATVSEINIDKTSPLVTASASPSANAHGWNNADVSVTFSATDALSGVLSCDPSAMLSLEGAGQSASGACMDLAGNSAEATASNINIDKTMPLLSFAPASPAANVNGWNNTNVAFAFTASDSLSGVDSTSTPSPLVLSAEGSAVSGMVSVTDLAGNTASFTSGVVMIDKTAPVVSASRAPLANAYGWNNTDVTVAVLATDALSGVASCEPSVTLSGEGAGQSVTRSCTDLAGNSASQTVSAINIDKTAPAVSGNPARPADKNGWYNHAMSLTWSGTDALSGVVSCSSASTYSGPDSAAASLSGNCSDRAGNQGSGSFALKYDATAPTVSIATPPNGTTYVLNQSVAAQYTCADNLSGVDGCSGPVASGAAISTSPVGPKTFKVTAMDAAGNQSSATNNYAVQYKFSGFLQPVDNLPMVNVANAGRTIPVKWQLKDAANASVSDLASAMSLLWAPMACDAAPSDIIEEETVATGGTVLRYDGTQFIYNWNTPKSWAGSCVQLQLTLADGTKQYAKFKFK